MKVINNKQAKKARKIYRQQYQEQYGKLTAELAERNSNFLKPKPKYFPMFLWVRMLRIFVKIK